MKTSQDRILTTHVGSLPRSQEVTDVVFGRENGVAMDEAQAEAVDQRSVEASQLGPGS